MELYNTGLDKSYTQDELSKLFNINKKDFLKSPDIPVIKRKFNWLPSDKGDPPRALTDPKAVPIVRYQQVGVVSDFHKGMVSSPTNKLWEDGTYDDMKKKVEKNNSELYGEIKFAPDYDFEMRFNRLEQEQSLQANMTNYFLEKQQEKELANRIILEQYGLNPEEVDKALAEKEAPIMKETQQMLLDWENGNEAVLTLWRKMNQWVYDGFDVTYQRIGSNFDKTYYESDTYLLGKDTVELGLQKGVFFKNVTFKRDFRLPESGSKLTATG